MVEIVVNNVKIYHYDTVGSTNRIAMELESPEHLLTVISDSQTEGRGRLGRSFYSYKGGLYMSVIIDVTKIGVKFHLITPAAALAVKKALEEEGVFGLSVKWVNDIMQNGGKVCGILTEARTACGKTERIVVGIGINLSENRIDFPEEIKNKAKSIDFNGDKLKLASKIVLKLGEYLSESSEKIASEYLKSLAFVGEEAEFTDYSDNNARIRGKIIGITDDCFLKIKLSDGREKILSSGEIIN